MSKSKVAGRVVTLFLAIVLPVFAAGQKNLPVLSSISPVSTTAGVVVTITANGSNFSTGSLILWNGVALTTTYVSTAKLTAALTSTQVTVAGTDKVSVYTAGRYGGSSAALSFTVNPATTSTTSSSSSSTTSTPLAITTTSIPIGTTGTAYSATLAATGGTTPYAWSLAGGALPPGLALSAAGAISGTPTSSGSYSFQASVKDAASSTQTYTYSTSIAQGSTTTTSGISLTSLSPSSASAGGPAFTLTLNGTGFLSGSVVYWNGKGQTTTFVSATQVTAAIPNTLIASAGTATVIVWVPGTSGGNTNTSSFTIGAATTTTTTTTTTTPTTPTTPLAITTTSIPAGTTGTAYSATLAATGGATPYTWSLSGSSLPPGLTLSSTGALSGTPTTSGSYSFSATVKDSASSSQSYTYSTSIAQGTSPLAISTTSVPNGTAGTAYPTTTIAATGGATPYSWTVSAGTIPAGLTLSSTTGAITGTPAAAASYSFSVTAKDSSNNTATKSYSLTVASATTTTATTATTTANACYNSTYGDCGDPYEGLGQPAATKTISACGTIAQATNDVFRLTADIGTDPTVACITTGFTNTHFTIDLNGHTVIGQINLQQSDTTGVIIEAGTLVCAITSGCIKNNASNQTSQSRFHHLVISQQYIGTSVSIGINNQIYATTLYAGGGSGSGKMIRMDHIFFVSTAGSSNRTYGLACIAAGRTDVGGSCEWDHNWVDAPATANQAWLQYSYGTQYSISDYNLIVLEANTVGSISRGMTFDGDLGMPALSGASFQDNDVTVNNNVGVRSRAATPGSTVGETDCYYYGLDVGFNTFRSVNNGNAAVFVGNNDNCISHFSGGSIHDNTFEIGNGHAIWNGTADGITVSGNAITCVGGSCGAAPPGALVRTDAPYNSTATWAQTGTNITVTGTNNATVLGTIPAVYICASPGTSTGVCTDAVDTRQTAATVSTAITIVGNGTITPTQ